ncbi:27021_t:CDS:1, partial [Gigaspora margarita]
NIMFNSHIKDANSEEFEPHAKHKIVSNISPTYFGETIKL